MSVTKSARRRQRRRRKREREDQGSFRKNWNVPCMNCALTPTVGDTALCGPCYFGEADTAMGNW